MITTRQDNETVDESQIKRDVFKRDLESGLVVSSSEGYIQNSKVFFDHWKLKYINGVLKKVGCEFEVSTLSEFYKVLECPSKEVIGERVRLDLIEMSENIRKGYGFVGSFKMLEDEFFEVKELYIARDEYFAQMICTYVSEKNTHMALTPDGLVYDDYSDRLFVQDYRLMLADMYEAGYVGLCDDRDQYYKTCEQIVSDTVYSRMASDDANYELRFSGLPAMVMQEMFKELCNPEYQGGGYMMREDNNYAFCIKGKDFERRDTIHRFNVYRPYGVVNNYRGEVRVDILYRGFRERLHANYKRRSSNIIDTEITSRLGEKIHLGRYTEETWLDYTAELQRLGLEIGVYFHTKTVFVVVARSDVMTYVVTYDYKKMIKLESALRILNLMVVYYKCTPATYYMKLLGYIQRLEDHFLSAVPYLKTGLNLLVDSNVAIRISIESLKQRNVIQKTDGRYINPITDAFEASGDTEYSDSVDADDEESRGIEEMQQDVSIATELVCASRADVDTGIGVKIMAERYYMHTKRFLLVLKMMQLLKVYFEDFIYRPLLIVRKQRFVQDRAILDFVVRECKTYQAVLSRKIYVNDLINPLVMYEVVSDSYGIRSPILDYVLLLLKEHVTPYVRTYKIKKKIYNEDRLDAVADRFCSRNKVWYVIGFGLTWDESIKIGIFWYLSKNCLYDHNAKRYCFLRKGYIDKDDV